LLIAAGNARHAVSRSRSPALGKRQPRGMAIVSPASAVSALVGFHRRGCWQPRVDGQARRRQKDLLSDFQPARARDHEDGVYGVIRPSASPNCPAAPAKANAKAQVFGVAFVTMLQAALVYNSCARGTGWMVVKQQHVAQSSPLPQSSNDGHRASVAALGDRRAPPRFARHRHGRDPCRHAAHRRAGRPGGPAAGGGSRRRGRVR
jgi:hypothetical protein